jgi:hypothetical protein
MHSIDEIAKEFYGQYGHAMHAAQMLERGLLELFALHEYINNKLTEIKYYEILSNPKKWTLGKIISEIKVYNLFDNTQLGLLSKANEYRIFLAHMFWWERNIEFHKNEELVKLHKEIFSYIELFNDLLKVVENKINKTRFDNNLNLENKMGITNFNDREAFIKSL